MGRIGPTEIVILLSIFIAIPVVIAMIAYRMGRKRGQLDEMLRQEQIRRNGS